MWNHFDAGGCPGQAVGIRIRLDNGVNGYIHLKNLSDKHVTDPEERVRFGQVIHARIMKIDVLKFSVEATSKASDLNDANNKWRYGLTLDYKGGHFFTHLLYKNVNAKACNFLHMRVFLHDIMTKVCNFLHMHFLFTQGIFLYTSL